jgi:proteasome lid subunit RPN8/RPN11
VTAATAVGSRTSLTVPEGELEILLRHAEKEYPRECCGILIGHLHKGGALVERALPTENQRRLRAGERYEISPRDLLRAMREAENAGADLVGYYHSHPDRPAIPSSTDESTAWPGVSYVIVEVARGRAGEVRSWRSAGGILAEETVSDGGSKAQLETGG